MNEALRAVAELKAEGIGFGRGGRCEDVYAALRLGDDAVLIADLPRKGRGRASERRGVAVVIWEDVLLFPVVRRRAWQTQRSATNSDLRKGACSPMHDNDGCTIVSRSLQLDARCS